MKHLSEEIGTSIILDIHRRGSKKQSLEASRFFKTGKGEYGEGDIFVGVRIPILRSIVASYLKSVKQLIIGEQLDIVHQLLYHQVHECRMAGLYILVDCMSELVKSASKTNSNSKEYSKIVSNAKTVFDFYMRNVARVNNWDLVDSSAYHIVGQYILLRYTDSTKTTLTEDGIRVLNSYAVSKNIWIRRISIVSTYMCIKAGIYTPTLHISEILLSDSHDLIHKAVGWMLREVGKKDINQLRSFLDKFALRMPRTMLRYSIEKMSKNERVGYMNKK